MGHLQEGHLQALAFSDDSWNGKEVCEMGDSSHRWVSERAIGMCYLILSPQTRAEALKWPCPGLSIKRRHMSRLIQYSCSAGFTDVNNKGMPPLSRNKGAAAVRHLCLVVIGASALGLKNMSQGSWLTDTRSKRHDKQWHSHFQWKLGFPHICMPLIFLGIHGIDTTYHWQSGFTFRVK